MAKIGSGYLGGFNGVLGPAIGYLWNGKWCVRSRPGQVRNPRTANQVACRQSFAAEVRLAAAMRWGVNAGLTAAAREAGMTAYNLFVSINQEAFAFADGQLSVQWPLLQLSVGPVAPVAFATPQVHPGNVLEIAFEKNPEHRLAANYDRVNLFVYCPDLAEGYLATPVYRRSKSLAVSLPDNMAGREVQLYGWVEDEQGRLSTTLYAGAVTLVPESNGGAATSALPDHTDTASPSPESSPSEAEAESPQESAAQPAAPRPPDAQLSLW